MDILSRLQALPPGRFHYKLLVLVGIGWLFDAMDTGIVSFILPALGKEWGLQPAQLGWIVSIAFIGMALGAVASGWLADRFGMLASAGSDFHRLNDFSGGILGACPELPENCKPVWEHFKRV